MSKKCPELIFVAGPQEGERVLLTTPVAVLGRSYQAEVYLAESYTSRRHVQFELTSEGWVVENLSSGGTQINDKTYKAGKRILLDTGDVLGVGAETQILFVSAGDDPERALAEYRSSHPAPQIDQPAQGEQAEATAEPAGPPIAPVGPPAEAMTTKTRPVAGQAPAGRSKLRKYAIFGVFYLAVLAGAVAFLSGLKTDKAEQATLERLKDEQIADAIGAPLDRPMNPTRAAETLRKARLLHPGYFNPGDLYRCVKNFKLHLAYKERPDFEDPLDAQKFRSAREELIERVTSTYADAYAFEKAKRWREAQRLYGALLKMLPETDRTNPVHRTLIKHFRRRAAFVSGQITTTRR